MQSTSDSGRVRLDGDHSIPVTQTKISFRNPLKAKLQEKSELPDQRKDMQQAESKHFEQLLGLVACIYEAAA